MTSVYLIDSSAYIFKYFYAIPMNTEQVSAKQTNALHGFGCMIMKMIEKDPRATFIVCYDSGSAHRVEVLPSYKQNRKACPEELKHQFGIIKRFNECVGVQNCTHIGFEADDCIASLANKFESDEKVSKVFIVSPDKDLNQILRFSKSVIYDPQKGTVTNSQDVINRYGVAPAQFQIYQAMTGDKVDNIPGVPKIGPKTALKHLVNNTVPTDHPDFIASLVLTTLVTNLSCECTTQLVAVKRDEMVSFLQDLEMNVLLSRFHKVFDI